MLMCMGRCCQPKNHECFRNPPSPFIVGILSKVGILSIVEYYVVTSILRTIEGLGNLSPPFVYPSQLALSFA